MERQLTIVKVLSEAARLVYSAPPQTTNPAGAGLLAKRHLAAFELAWLSACAGKVIPDRQ
jgi:hypothetical protein